MAASGSTKWSDLQLLAAIVKCRSLTRAAADLGWSQPTLSRRIRALEEEIGGPLFHRSQSGIAPTELARRISLLLVPAEDAITRVQRAVAESRQQQRSFRLTTTATISLLLAEHIDSLSPAPGGTCLDVQATRRVADFNLHECDMAIRLRRQPSTGPVRTRKLGSLAFAVYAEHRYSAQRRADIPFIALSDDRPPPHKQWFDGFVQDVRGRVVARLGEVHLRLMAVKTGVGASLLPCVLGDREASLTRLTPPVPDLTEDIYYLIHSDIARQPDAREISARLVRLFKDNGPELAGLRPVAIRK